jgi:glutathione-specific gamma-glutamylcyclotransferase
VSGSRLPSTSASEPHVSAPRDPLVWIFAYGSLMWRPGFDHELVLDARLRGYHRALCVYSWVHRGTQERPGLVLGLDRGGSCRGRALGIAREREAEILAYLDERELVTDVYRRTRLPVVTARGRVLAWGYVVRQDHVQYAGKLEEDRLLELVQNGTGRSGRCCDYVVSTVAHLEQMGIADGPLHALARRLIIQA